MYMLVFAEFVTFFFVSKSIFVINFQICLSQQIIHNFGFAILTITCQFIFFPVPTTINIWNGIFNKPLLIVVLKLRNLRIHSMIRFVFIHIMIINKSGIELMLIPKFSCFLVGIFIDS